MHTLMLYLDGGCRLPVHLRYRTSKAALNVAKGIEEAKDPSRPDFDKGQMLLLDDEGRLLGLNAFKVEFWVIEPPWEVPALPG